MFRRLSQNNSYKIKFVSISTITFLYLLLSFSIMPIHALSPYDSGYEHGCSDADIADSYDQYINQPGQGSSYHSYEFMQGYNAGYADCSGTDDWFYSGHSSTHSGNDASQSISQDQSSNQNSQCVAGGSLGNSCNNINVQNQANSGNNAAAQDGRHGHGGNSANQGIGQSQSSNQNSQCVSGKDAIVSCNNLDFQNQVNSGNNALAQQ